MGAPIHLRPWYADWAEAHTIAWRESKRAEGLKQREVDRLEKLDIDAVDREGFNIGIMGLKGDLQTYAEMAAKLRWTIRHKMPEGETPHTCPVCSRRSRPMMTWHLANRQPRTDTYDVVLMTWRSGDLRGVGGGFPGLVGSDVGEV